MFWLLFSNVEHDTSYKKSNELLSVKSKVSQHGMIEWLFSLNTRQILCKFQFDHADYVICLHNKILFKYKF